MLFNFLSYIKNFILLANYTMTDKDFCAQIIIESSLATDILVKIDHIFVNQDQLSCLLDPVKYLNDDVSVPMCFKISLSNI